jgi:protease secretion system outer membrane protein
VSVSKLTPIALALALAAGSAHALTLEQAYDLAVRNDPVYRTAFFDREAGQENAKLGLSNLLPQVSASYSSSRNITDQTQVLSYLPAPSVTHPRYISRSGVVQVRQTVFNLDALARYRQGKAQARDADARFEYSSLDIIVRVVSAYADALYAIDQLRLTEAQRDTYLEHKRVNERLFVQGEGTKTDMLEVQARLDLSEAQIVEGKDAVKSAIEALEGVVGVPVDSLSTLSDDFRVAPLEPTAFEAWREIALSNNPELKVARATVEIQNQEVKKAYAGHLPRLDLIATYSDATSDSISTYNISTVSRSIGFQLNIPLYSGGQVNATARQAVATRERARTDLDARTNKVLLDLRKAHSGVLSAQAKLAALEKTVASNRELIKATEQSIKGGVRINLDLLNAQQQLVTSQRDLAQARYTYLLSVMRMKQAAGTLSAADVHDIARYFR